MHDVTSVLTIAREALVELLPYFFLAIAIGASVDLLYLDIPARRSFRRHGLLGIVFTTGLGALSPFCSFTVVPLIRKLLGTGVPLSAVMAFWIASPAMDPPIFALTAAQLGLPLAAARLLGALILSVGAGLFVLALERRGHLQDVLRRPRETDHRLEFAPAAVAVPALVSAGASARTTNEAPLTGAPGVTATGVAADENVSGCGCPTANDEEEDNRPWWPTAKQSLRTKQNWVITGRNVVRDSLSLGKWLALACVFLGVIRVYVPTDFVAGTLGDKGLWAIPLSVLVSIPLYLNGVGAIPIVGGLLAKGMAQGAVVSFLLGGAITTIPAMAAVRSVVNNRVFIIYLAVGLLGSTALGFIAQALL